MIIGSEANPEWVAVSPRERLDGQLRILGVRLRPQDRARADFALGAARGRKRTLESIHRGARSERAMRRITTADMVPGIEPVFAQHNVLTGNLLLVEASRIVMPDYRRVRRRAL